MTNQLLLGRGKRIIQISPTGWQIYLAKAPQRAEIGLAFMTNDHIRIRYFLVTELPRAGEPISAASIAQQLSIPLTTVNRILDELEEKLFFLVRDEMGAVAWAFPITIRPTPHHLKFSTGEIIYAAWAEDAIETPFVQGRLRGEYLSVDITTVCAYSKRKIQINVDSNLNYQVHSEGAQPLIFEPRIDFGQDKFKEPTIIDAYWHNALYFWSEVDARAYRTENTQVDGFYLTLEQSTYKSRIIRTVGFPLR